MTKNDRRGKIMQAAEKLFTSRRFHEITLDDVVAEAHVGKGTVYRYFRNKDDLFFQVATSGFDQLCDLLSDKVPEGAPFLEQLASACDQIIEFYARRRQLFRMMQVEEARMQWRRGQIRQQWAEQRKRLVGAVAKIISKGVEEGKVRNDIPPDVLAGFLLGMLRSRPRDLTGLDESLRPTELVVELFWKGAGAEDGRARRRSTRKANVSAGRGKKGGPAA